MNWSRRFLPIAVGAAALACLRSVTAQDERPIFLDRTLARLPPRAVLGGEPLASRDGGVVAFAVSESGRWSVSVNGVRGQWFEALGPIAIAPDDRTVYHVARDGPREVLVRDHGVLAATRAGQPDAPLAFDRIERFVVRDDSRVVAYEARIGRETLLVVDETAHPLGENLKGIEFWFDSDSGAAVAVVEDQGATLHAFVDGVEDEGIARVGDGFRITIHVGRARRAVYVAEGVQDDRARLVLPAESRDYDGLRAPQRHGDRETFLARHEARIVRVTVDLDAGTARESPLLELPDGSAEWTASADGTHVAFVAYDDGKQVLHITGPEFTARSPACDAFQLGTLRMDQKARRYACVATDGDGTFVVVGERRFGPWEDVATLVTSELGTAAWIARRGEELAVVVGGRVGPWFDRVTHLGFAPDGKTAQYVALRGERSFTVIGTKPTSRDGADESKLPVYSADGAGWAHRARHGEEWRIVTNLSAAAGAASFAQVSVPRIGADGRTLAYVGRAADGDHLVLGGRTCAVFDRIFAGPFLSADGTMVAFGALRDGLAVWRVLDVEP